MRAQEKVPKEKGTRSPRRLRRCPAFLAIPGARITRQPLSGLPQTGCAPFPRNGCGTRRGLRDPGFQPIARRRSRASQGKPGQARPCLSELSVSEIASWASAGFPEKHRGPAIAGKPTGHLSFGYFSLVAKEKYLARQGEIDAEIILRVCRYVYRPLGTHERGNEPE